MQTVTHTVVGVDENSSLLKQFAMLGEFHPEMERVVWTENAHDAEIVRRALQEGNNRRDYYVLDGRK
jgi:hypothetical protein